MATTWTQEGSRRVAFYEVALASGETSDPLPLPEYENMLIRVIPDGGTGTVQSSSDLPSTHGSGTPAFVNIEDLVAVAATTDLMTFAVYSGLKVSASGGAVTVQVAIRRAQG